MCSVLSEFLRAVGRADILAEAMHKREEVKLPVVEDVKVSVPLFGLVGGRIVAEVFLGLMFGDRHSMLSIAPGWKPEGVQTTG